MANTILMLEHDDDDRYITQTVFDENNYAVKVKFVNNSQEFFDFLKDCDAGKNEYPSLILLNYYAGPLNAVQILRLLKEDDRYSSIPSVVLSGYRNDSIVKESYRYGASSFIEKPATAVRTNEKLDSFIEYWFRTVELPK
jgi:CheY-like chemotaxis protein